MAPRGWTTGLTQTVQSSSRRRLPLIALALFVAAFVFYWSSPSLQTSFGEYASRKPIPPARVDKPAMHTPVVEKPSAAAQPNATDTQMDKTPSSGEFTIGKKVAVIIETRTMANLIPLILHFSGVLGPDWPIILFTSGENVTESAPFRRKVRENAIKVHTLPDGFEFTNQQSVSNFLTRTWFWEQLAPAEHVLLFQADSMICANAPQTVDDYLQYDFVGAPIDEPYGRGFNGGFSLRNRKLTLDVIKANLPKKGGDIPDVGFEDQWFYDHMVALPPKPNGEPGANLPTIDVAKTFAAETIHYDRPLGYHQAVRYSKIDIEEIMNWCPEYSLCTDDLIVAHDD